MSLYSVIKRAIGVSEPARPAPVMAQLTIISTEPRIKRPSGSRSPQARA